MDILVSAHSILAHDQIQDVLLAACAHVVGPVNGNLVNVS